MSSNQDRLRQCGGWVTALRGHTVAYTGYVLIDGTWVPQAECAARAATRHAFWRDDWSSAVTLLVHGDLAGKHVVNPEQGYSHKLLGAQQSRQQGRHVHVVDGDGFGDLLAGKRTRCRRLGRRAEHVMVLPEPDDRILGAPLKPRRAPRRASSNALRVDWDRIDAATAAHERTIRALIAHLGRQDVETQEPWRRAPRFDAGWTRGKTVYIAEVKSLRGTREDQQLRLGLGQLLDYVHQIPNEARRVVPALILERQPSSGRWDGLCLAHGVHLAWAPDFRGL